MGFEGVVDVSCWIPIDLTRVDNNRGESGRFVFPPFAI